MCCQPTPATRTFPTLDVATGCAAQPQVLLLNGQQVPVTYLLPPDTGAAAPVPWQTFILNNGGAQP